MWPLLWFSRVRSSARAASVGLALLVMSSLPPGAAASTIDCWVRDCGSGWSWPGISLADLADGREFESLSGELIFSDFQAHVDGHAIHDLDAYRVLPTEGGFKLFSPLMVLFGHDAELTLDYQVATTEEELIVTSVSLSFLGFALGDAEASVEESLFASQGDFLGALSVARTGPFNAGWSRDELDLDPILSELFVSEVIGLQTGWKSCFGGLAALPVVNHSFEVGPVPEPSTALLLALGLAAVAGSRRRQVDS